MKQLVGIALLVSFLFSCSSLHMEKRRYRKGFHVSWNKKIKEQKSNLEEVSVHPSGPIQNNMQTSIIQSEIETVNDAVVTLEKLPVYVNSSQPQATGSQAMVIHEDSKQKKVKQVVSKISKQPTKEKVIRGEISGRRTSGLFYFLLLAIAPLIALQKKRGLRISKWASMNRAKAQALIALSTVVGVASSFGLGNLLQFDVTSPMLIVSLGLGVASLLTYQVKGSKETHLLKNRLSFSLLNIGSTFGAFYIGANMESVMSRVEGVSDPYIMDPAVAILLTVCSS